MLTNSDKKEARDMLNKLKGKPPYDNFCNICYNDNYFAQSIINRFGMSLYKLEKELEKK